MKTTFSQTRADTDPRTMMSANALIVASQNTFPVVARDRRGRDHAGLLAGIAALALGAGTFWLMAENRTQIERDHLIATPPEVVSAPPTAVVVPPSSTFPLPEIAAAPSVATLEHRIDRARSPLLVLDTLAMPQVAAIQATDVAVDRAQNAGTQAPAADGTLSGDEAFALRVSRGGRETTSALAPFDPSRTVSQGTLIAAALETGIDTDLPGFARAMVTEDVRSFDGSRVLIPKTSRIVGQYKSGLAAGQRRAYVLWTRLIRPDGVSIALASPGIESDGRTGLSGEVDSHFMARFGSAMMLSVVGAASVIGNPSILFSGTQSAAAVAAQRDAQIPPTVTVPAGQSIRIFTAKDMSFPDTAPATASN